MNCPKCGLENRSAARFCRQCGQTLQITPPAFASRAICPACGTSARPGARFCRQCGRALSTAPPISSSSLNTTCPACDTAVKPSDYFCPRCGEPLTIESVSIRHSVITLQADSPFITEGRQCPVRRVSLQPGERIIVCQQLGKNAEIVASMDGWLSLGGHCPMCGLSNIPLPHGVVFDEPYHPSAQQKKNSDSLSASLQNKLESEESIPSWLLTLFQLVYFWYSSLAGLFSSAPVERE